MTQVWLCYGLRVSSEIDLPDLGEPLDDADQVDVRIRYGDVPPFRRPAGGPGYVLLRDGDRCHVEVPEVGRFSISGGAEVLLDPAPGAEDRILRMFVLGTVMGAVMMQRDHLVLHGNAIRIGDACAVVVGHSGAGKSTLAAEFDRRGFDVLSDDVVPVDRAGRALPGYPRIKLWDDALERLGRSTEGLERIHDDHEKFQVPLRRNDLAPLPLRWIYVLERHTGEDLVLEQAHGATTFGLLHEHTYRNELLQGTDAAAQHLRQCAGLMASARLTRVLRPAATMTAAATAAAILADVQPDLEFPRPKAPPQECA